MVNAIDASQTLSLIKLHAFIFAGFTAIYSLMDFERHFGTNVDNAVYFSATVHTSFGFGDVTPKTREAKMIVTMHMLASFVATLLVLERL